MLSGAFQRFGFGSSCSATVRTTIAAADCDGARLIQMLGEEGLHPGLGVSGSEAMEPYGVA